MKNSFSAIENFSYVRSKNRVSIRILSYNKNFINFFLFKLKTESKLCSIFKLPIKKPFFTVLRSPFVNKKSRIQVGFKMYKWKITFDYYDFFTTYYSFRKFIEKFFLNKLKKNLTSKYAVSCKIYRSSFFF